MDTSEATIERDIQAKGLNAPRLTPAQIDGAIAGETYYTFPGTTLTVCVLTLVNGFWVTGESAAASPENFDVAIGRRIARENARQKIWALEGYLLKDRLHRTKVSVEAAPVVVPAPPPQARSDLYDDLQHSLRELADVVQVVATDVPLSEDVATRLGLAVAQARRLIGGT